MLVTNLANYGFKKSLIDSTSRLEIMEFEPQIMSLKNTSVTLEAPSRI